MFAFLKAVKNFPPIYAVYVRTVGILIKKKKENKKRNNFKRFGLEVWKEVQEIASSSDIGLLCVFGTLLGVVRDNGIIPYDYDIDLALVNHKDLPCLEKELSEHGLKKIRQFEIDNVIELETWQQMGVDIDIYIIQSDEEGLYLNTIWRYPNKRYKNGKKEFYRVLYHRMPIIERVKNKRIYNFDVLIPENAEEVVEAFYGKGWKTPDPNFRHQTPREEKKLVKEIYF